MDPVSIFRMAVDSITAHKLRSFLVTLGIRSGITAVLVNAAMVEGFRAYFQEQMQALGSNFVIIRPPTSIGLVGPQLQGQDLLASYLFEPVRRLPYVDDATASRTTFGTMRFMGEESSVIVVGTEPGYLTAKNREMIVGDELVPQDMFNAVLGDTAISSASQRPVSLMSQFELVLTVNGEEVTEKFRVKGVVEEPETGIGIGTIYVPIRAVNDMLGNEGYDEITLFASDIKNIDIVEQEATQMLDRLLHVKPEDQFAEPEVQEGFFGVPPPLTGEKEEYKILTQADVLEISQDITAMIQIALVAIAGISLLVGGIGIANVMLVTVTERTREIGVMKAVGAKNRQVLTSFLFEAGFIGIIGGILGLSIAAAAAFTLIPIIFDVPGTLPVQWAAIAIGISLAISVLSGLYPALRAARMDPVEALRSQ